MRKILFLPVLFAFAASARAGEQLFPVTPQSLDRWIVTGAENVVLAPGQPVVLPAGAQLARSFPTGDVAVTLVTQPIFGLDPADLPVLEIGGVALVFQRNGTEGKLALALGNKEPLVLPFAIKLDDAGQSVEPLVVNFARRGTVVAISVSGKTLQFFADPPTTPALEIVASAGASRAWSLESMTVIVTTPDAGVETDPKTPLKNGSSGQGAAVSGQAAGKSDALLDSSSAPAGTAAGTAEGKSILVTVTATPAGRSTALEVFTPASVRYGRADAIRSTLAKKPSQ